MSIFIFLISILVSAFLVVFFVDYKTHIDMVNGHITYNNMYSNSFNEFKKNFYKRKWFRDIRYKYSFFSADCSDFNDYNSNYIHASIVVVNGIKFKFSIISYLRYKIFLIKNKTTIANKDIIVNNICEIRSNKLKQLKKLK